MYILRVKYDHNVYDSVFAKKKLCGFPILILFRCTIFFVSVFEIQIPLKTLFTLCIKYQQHHPPGLLKNILCETLDSQISRVVCTYYIVLLPSRKCITLKYFLIYRYILHTMMDVSTHARCKVL